jgi:hypothetical protein
MCGFCDFEIRVHAVVEAISVIGVDLGFEDNVRECQDLHSQPLIDMDIVELKQQCNYCQKEEIMSQRKF